MSHEPMPLSPTRHTVAIASEDALRAAREIIAVTEHLVEMLEANPNADQWRVLESIVQGMGTTALKRLVEPIRTGRSAAVLIATADKAAAARRQDHQDALVVQMDRMGMRDDLETGQSSGAPEGIHQIFINLLRSVAPPQVAL